MRPTPRTPATTRAALACMIGVGPLLGCAHDDAPRAEADVKPAKRTASWSAPSDDANIRFAVWSPATDARIVTIDRSAVFTVVDGAGDLLAIRTVGVARGASSPYHTWIVALDREAAPGRAFEIGTDARAWVLHQDFHGVNRAAPAKGTISIHEREDGTLGASLSLSTEDTNLSTPGVYYDGAWTRVVRAPAIETSPIETRSGLPTPAKEKEERRPTFAVWPWEEIFGNPNDFRTEVSR